MVEQTAENIVVFSGNNSELVAEALAEKIPNFALVQGHKDDAEMKKLVDQVNFSLIWKPTIGYKSDAHKHVKTLFNVGTARKNCARMRVVNHFPNNAVLCTKASLFRNLEHYYRQQRVAVDEVVPQTFILSNVGGIDWISFRKAFKTEQKEWICKPTGLNCGRGIEVHSDLESIRKYVVRSNTPVVVQKYITNPLLWPNGNRKFDIRIWVLVLENGKVFMAKRGYLRTCSEPFSFENLSDSTAHLTNYCLQRKSSSLGKFEAGNTLSFEDLQELLHSESKTQQIDVDEDLLPRLQAIVMDTIRATWKDLNRVSSRNGLYPFELFGYDFMLDTDIKPWLIEVNTNPFLGVQNAWHGELLKKMTREMASIVKQEYFDQQSSEQGVTLFQRIDKLSKAPKGRGRVLQKWLTLSPTTSSTATSNLQLKRLRNRSRRDLMKTSPNNVSQNQLQQQPVAIIHDRGETERE